MNKIPQFNTLKFATDTEFSAWLIGNTTHTIDLKDFGQDMLIIYVHKTGEILHTNTHSQIYAGKFVNLEKLKLSECLEIWDQVSGTYVPYGRLIIQKIFSFYPASLKTKRFSVTPNVGRVKYLVSYHNGEKTHTDGSDFFDVKICKSKKELTHFTGELVKSGYKKL